MARTNWTRREKGVMKDIGANPVALSGAGWLDKEDGQTEDCLIQLKSTERKSITIKLDDVLTLIRNARVAHKRPVFVLEFVGEEILLVAAQVEDLKVVAKSIKRGGK